MNEFQKIEVAVFGNTGPATPEYREVEQHILDTVKARKTPKPAIISIACIFVTCPTCSTDIPITTPDGETVDWPLACIEDPEGTAKCPDCGQVVLVTLPRSLPVSP